MGSDNDQDHRRKSHRRDSGSSHRGKHRSSREGDRDRRDRHERDDDDKRRRREYSGEGRRRERERDRERSRNRKSRRRDDGDAKGDGEGGGKKLTKKEERLYARAREYLERREGGGGEGDRRERGKPDEGGGEKRRRKRRDERHGSSGSDSSSVERRDDKKRSRKHSSSRGKEHKRSRGGRDDSDDHGKSRHKKKSKRGHRDDEKHDHKKRKHGSKREESFRDKASPVDPSALISLGKKLGEPPKEMLDAETAYFSHNSHLRLYLYRKHGIYFEDLTSEESHDAFKEFAKSYNSGELEGAYYNDGGLLPQEALDQCSRTKHQWKFRTNKVEERSLEVVRAGVKKQTEYSEKGGDAARRGAPSFIGRGAVSNQPVCMPVNKRDSDEASGRKTPQEMTAQRQSDKRHRERIRLANEEMHGVGGKADHGWERKLEKRRERSEKVHGAARDREGEAWGGAELDDDALYGGGGPPGGRRRGEATYEEAAARERKYRERRDREKATRASELLQKEEEKRKKMFEMLGLKPGQERIVIAPRDDAA